MSPALARAVTALEVLQRQDPATCAKLIELAEAYASLYAEQLESRDAFAARVAFITSKAGGAN